jgi:hypothetical protein
MKVNRRKFLGMAAASSAITIVPRRVLGGRGWIAPSDKITVGYIGAGSEGLGELPGMLQMPEFQIVAFADPVKYSTSYIDFDDPPKPGAPFEGRRKVALANFMGKPDWHKGEPGLPGGRDVAKEVTDWYYAQERGKDTFKGVNTYIDFRELLEKENIDAVKIMTPDHLHATVAMAAMRKKKHVAVHKPLANRINEARLVIETARQTGVATYFLAWRGRIDPIAKMINDGAIGTLREIHVFSTRPVWPSFQQIPTERPPIPANFDWDMWLGPVPHRPYSPKYTNLVFRGWYEFGGGAIADDGIYSMWPIMRSLNLPSPISANPTAPRPFYIKGTDALVSTPVVNPDSFPQASQIQFRIPAANGRPVIDMYWYDGMLKPPRPPEFEEDNREWDPTNGGVLYIGDKGKIFNGRLLPESRAKAYGQAPEAPRGQFPPPGAAGRASGPGAARQGGPGGARPGNPWDDFIKACKGGPQNEASFLNALEISDLQNLAAVALRAGSKVVFDPKTVRITNNEAANKFLTREYRKGWELGPLA